MRTAQNKKRSKAKSEEQQKKSAALIVVAHQEYLDVAERNLSKAKATLAMFEQRGYADDSMSRRSSRSRVSCGMQNAISTS
jgi:hypothetical protein